MRIDWAYKEHGLAGFDALLDRFPAKEFDLPTRSTIPLLEYWRSPEPRIRKLTDALNLSVPQRVRLDFEHRVYPQRGKGKASHTDLMATSPEFAIAIEAKWTEPRYVTVGSWRGDSRNRRKVLRGWLDQLERRGAGLILKRDVRNLPYQMVHRAASACCVEGVSNRWLVYIDGSGRRRGYSNDAANRVGTDPWGNRSQVARSGRGPARRASGRIAPASWHRRIPRRQRPGRCGAGLAMT